MTHPHVDFICVIRAICAICVKVCKPVTLNLPYRCIAAGGNGAGAATAASFKDTVDVWPPAIVTDASATPRRGCHDFTRYVPGGMSSIENDPAFSDIE